MTGLVVYSFIDLWIDDPAMRAEPHTALLILNVNQYILTLNDMPGYFDRDIKVVWTVLTFWKCIKYLFVLLTHYLTCIYVTWNIYLRSSVHILCPNKCIFKLLGGAFEWEDDFPSPDPSYLNKPAANLIGSKLSVNPSKYFSPPPPSRGSDENWTHASSYSRFSISPANIASFSLTHLTDSDIEQGGKCFNLVRNLSAT